MALAVLVAALLVMSDYPFGGKPKSDAPTFFTFDASDVATYLPPLAGWITLTAMGIPTLPQFTADFCKVLPSRDFGDALDLGLLPLPPLALMRGSYGKWGNRIRAAKWDDLCDLSDGPYVGLGGDPPSTWDFYYKEQNITFTGDGTQHFVWVSDEFPTYLDAIAVRVISFTGDRDFLNWSAEKGDIKLGDEVEHPFYVRMVANGNGNIDPIGTWDYKTLTRFTPGDRFRVGWTYHTTSAGPVTLQFSIAWHPIPPPVGGATDPMPDIPGYPTTGGPCDAPTLPDLCKSLKDLHDKVDVLTRNANPPASPFDGPPQKPEPVLPVPTDPAVPKPLKPVLKPIAAIGAVVKATTIPDWAARYGTNPTFYPAIGHVALLTENGPLPSQLLKHNPMVIEPLPGYVTAIQLDLEAGVEAEITYLYPPTEPPPPVLP